MVTSCYGDTLFKLKMLFIVSHQQHTAAETMFLMSLFSFYAGKKTSTRQGHHCLTAATINNDLALTYTSAHYTVKRVQCSGQIQLGKIQDSFDCLNSSLI